MSLVVTSLVGVLTNMSWATVGVVLGSAIVTMLYRFVGKRKIDIGNLAGIVGGWLLGFGLVVILK
jgi:hypothetical protein